MQNQNATFTMSNNGSVRIENSSGYIELKTDGDFEINGKIFRLHSHTQPPDSAGNTEQNTGPVI